jgi:hypothetical protein
MQILSPCHEIFDLGPGQRRLTVLAFPRYYRRGEGWATTVEALRAGESPWLAEAAEGVHTLRVRRDGLALCSHLGHDLAFRLRGIVALTQDGTESEAVAVDLAKWAVDLSGLGLGMVAWTHASGARYEVRYVADQVLDRLILTDDLRAAIRAKLPARAARFGLAFDCSMPPGLRRFVDGADEMDHDTDRPIEMRAGTIRQQLVPSSVVDPRAAADALDRGWRERWRYRGGRLLQTLPIEALDAAAELRTTVVYQQGVDGYSGCTDAWIEATSGKADYNSGASAYAWIGFYQASSERRNLIRFDLSALSGVTAVASATLEFYVYDDWFSTGVTVKTARLLREWNEGTKDSATAGTGEATWNSAKHNQVAWTTAGADSLNNDRTAFSATMAWTSTENEFKSLNVQAWAEDWLVDGSPNYGMLVAGVNNAELDLVRSREYASASLRPKLTIDYSQGGEFDGRGLARSMPLGMPRGMHGR